MIKFIKRTFGILLLILALGGVIVFFQRQDVTDLMFAIFFGLVGYLLIRTKKETRTKESFDIGNYVEKKSDVDYSCTNVAIHTKPNITYTKTPLFKDFVVLDFETTGLSSLSDRIIEIGLVKYRDGVVVDSFGTLINPKKHIPIEASRVNNITDAMVVTMPTISDIHDQFVEFIKGETLVAHNAPFDIGFMLNSFNLATENINVFDTLAYCRKFFNFQNNKLNTVVRSLKIDITPTHRSISDCLAVGEVYLKIREHFEKTEIIPAALAYEKEGNLDKAIELYEKAVSNNYDGSKPYEKLATYYRKNKDSENEIRVLNKAIYVYGNLIPATQPNRDVKLEKFKTQLEKAMS